MSKGLLHYLIKDGLIVSWLRDCVVYNLSRTSRKALAILLDFLLLNVALWTSFVVRFGEWWPVEILNNWWLFLVTSLTGCMLLSLLGVYDVVHRFTNNKTLYLIAQGISAHVVLVITAIGLFGSFDGMPRSVFFTYWLTSLVLITASRITVRSILGWLEGFACQRQLVVIYGAGSAGAQLARSLSFYGNYQPIAFIDDKSDLHGAEIEGLGVYPSKALRRMIRRQEVKHVLLAIPSASVKRRREVIGLLEQLQVTVKSVPTLEDLISGQFVLEDLREIDVDDLLGRVPVTPNPDLLCANITGKSVLITGGGGSIGSELARQVLKLGPAKLVLFEISEYALYRIERELNTILEKRKEVSNVKVIPILGNVLNTARVLDVIQTFDVDTIYHAAAYKHVPLVESNPIEGIRNNVMGTWSVARASQIAGVDTFILISTDKAVRPTNTMGAAKRVAELIIQGFAANFRPIKFSIVRFGNVLDSSGSVVPLFRDQIRNGGPVTVTDPDIIRFFMTIPEAAQLVIQAGSMGTIGDVFVLDMGEPVRIADLAVRMIRLAGLEVRNENNPSGDIEITYTGLRPGEKLYEETLVGEMSEPTSHPAIQREHEKCLKWHDLLNLVNELTQACDELNCTRVRELLEQTISEFEPQCDIQDCVWMEQKQNNQTPDKIHKLSFLHDGVSAIEDSLKKYQ